MSEEKHAIFIDNLPGESISVEHGVTLRDALTSAGYSVPSACGGKGLCGLCRIKVLSGGGELQPAELKKISKHDLDEGFRLSCQVKVTEDIRISLAPAMMNASEYECTVISNHNVASFIKEVVLELPEGKKMDFKAGSYIQLESPPYSLEYRDFDILPQYHHVWSKFNVWDYTSHSQETVHRTYSLANYPGENDNRVVLNVRVATPAPNVLHARTGIVSSYIFGLKPGDKVKISGPYGTFHTTDTNKEMVFIGGGAGMAPLRSQILDHLYHKKSGRRMSFWYGARNEAEAFYLEEFDKAENEHPNFFWKLAYSDQTATEGPGVIKGFIHNVLYERYLKDHPDPSLLEYYLCGPPIMLKVSIEMLTKLGVSKSSIFYDDFGS